MTYILDRETGLFPRESGQLYAICGETFKNPTGSAFGGWVAAIAARAVEEHPDCAAPLISLQMSYLRGVGQGEVDVDVRLLKSGASTQFWRVELSQGGDITNTADIVTSRRAPTDLDFQLEMPPAPSRAEGEEMTHVPGMNPNWTVIYHQHIVKGTPFTDNGSPESLTWINHADRRPLDRMGIIALCDTPMPRSFFLSDVPRFGSTVSMSTYIYASEEEIAAAGTDDLLIRVDGATVRNSANDQRVELWSKSGVLLATSNQIGFFR